MIINIHDREDAEYPFLLEVMARILRHQHVETADIYVNERDVEGRRNPPGWIEYLVVMKYTTGGKLTLGCLQRAKGAETEFHT